MGSPGRRPGPLLKYTVESTWPVAPNKWRKAVEEADEKIARRSVAGLREIRHRSRITVTFVKGSSNLKGRSIMACHLVSEWGSDGQIRRHYKGELCKLIPGWVLGVDEAKGDEDAA